MNKQIVVVDYDPSWEESFLALKRVYETNLKGLCSDIQHVGSTSVPGLAAKPIIDIDIAIHDKSNLPAVIEGLRPLGYNHEGEMGIAGRDAFRRIGALVPINGKGTVWPDHNLYCCVDGSISYQNHIRFRDYLRRHPDSVIEYGNLKKRLAKEHPLDIDKYVELKTPFIINILNQEGLSEYEAQVITAQNTSMK